MNSNNVNYILVILTFAFISGCNKICTKKAIVLSSSQLGSNEYKNINMEFKLSNTSDVDINVSYIDMGEWTSVRVKEKSSFFLKVPYASIFLNKNPYVFHIFTIDSRSEPMFRLDLKEGQNEEFSNFTYDVKCMNK